MLTKGELLHLLVAWSCMGDADLADDDACLSAEVCSPDDREPVRRAAHLVDSLRREFRYVESPRFLQEVSGKSPAYAAMRRRLQGEPTKRPGHLSSFNAALKAILTSREVYDLVPTEGHAELDLLRDVLEQVGNPD